MIWVAVFEGGPHDGMRARSLVKPPSERMLAVIGYDDRNWKRVRRAKYVESFTDRAEGVVYFEFVGVEMIEVRKPPKKPRRRPRSVIEETLKEIASDASA